MFQIASPFKVLQVDLIQAFHSVFINLCCLIILLFRLEFFGQEEILFMQKTSGRQKARHPLKGIMEHVKLFVAARKDFGQAKPEPDGQIEVVGDLHITVESKTGSMLSRFLIFIWSKLDGSVVCS